MKKFIFIIVSLLSFNYSYSQCEKNYDHNIIINEIGSFVRHNGNNKHTNSEYIELLVIGDPNRPFSPVDISGIVIDDNDVDNVEIGTEYGYIKISDNFPMVSPGTIILIYDDDGFVVSSANDGMPNQEGIYQIPLSSSVIEKNDWGGDYQNINTIRNWNDLIPFRNMGDVAQIKSPDGQVIHSLAWIEEDKELPRPDGSFYFENTWLRNKSIQLINGDYSNISAYRISGFNSPGEPNSSENEVFINSLKSGVINKFGDFDVRIIRNQTEGESDASIEVELLGELSPDYVWDVYIDDVPYSNEYQDNPFVIYDLTGGTKVIRIEIVQKEEGTSCPFEQTIEIPIDKIIKEEVCNGKCITLESDGTNCVAWLDEDGNLLSNDVNYEVCSKENVKITELIENEAGIVIKRIIHEVKVKKVTYTKKMDLTDDCPPKITLSIEGSDLTTEWNDGSTNTSIEPTAAGTYTVTITSTKNSCDETESFVLDAIYFLSTDTDKDGVCDAVDCDRNDATIAYKKGDPCDDHDNCTENDRIDDSCQCHGTPIKGTLTVEIEGDVTLCKNQTTTTLMVKIGGDNTDALEILWDNGSTDVSIDADINVATTYTVTVSNKLKCNTASASVTLQQLSTGDFDGDGYCDEEDCTPYSNSDDGPGSPCNDGNVNTVNDKLDADCNCVGEPKKCNSTDLDHDGVCDDIDCDSDDPNIGVKGSKCNDKNPNTINDIVNEDCICKGVNKIVNKICLTEVHFGGTINTNYIPITKDDNSGIFKAPQFVMTNPQNCTGNNGVITTRYPVAYVSNTRAKVKAVFNTKLSNGQKYYIKGVGPNLDSGVPIIFEQQHCEVISGIITYPFKSADTKFVKNKVKYWKDFKIKWQILANGSDWTDIGESVNTVYVTHGIPILTHKIQHYDPTVAFHTILHLGCKNASGFKSENLIIDKIYTTGFSTASGYNKVFRVDGAGPIQYWGKNTPKPACWQVSEMLINLDGRCGGWVSLFEDVIRIQGVNSTTISIVTNNKEVLSSAEKIRLENEIKVFFGTELSDVILLDDKNIDVNISKKDVRADFFVKKWDLSSSVDFVRYEGYSDYTLNNGNIIKREDEIGAAAQGNSNPTSTFSNHAIVKNTNNNKYYDPSYGSIAADKNTWETNALDGFGSIIMLKKGIKKYYFNWIGAINNPANTQSTIIP